MFLDLFTRNSTTKDLWQVIEGLNFHRDQLVPLIDGEYEELPTKVFAGWARDTEVSRIPELFTIKSYSWFLKIKANSVYPYHKDVSRPCALNFPICFGKESTTLIYDEKKQKEYAVPYKDKQGVLVNTAKYHQIDNLGSPERIILTTSFYEPFEEVQRLYKEGKLINPTAPQLKIISLS